MLKRNSKYILITSSIDWEHIYQMHIFKGVSGKMWYGMIIIHPEFADNKLR